MERRASRVDFDDLRPGDDVENDFQIVTWQRAPDGNWFVIDAALIKRTGLTDALDERRSSRGSLLDRLLFWWLRFSAERERRRSAQSPQSARWYYDVWSKDSQGLWLCKSDGSAEDLADVKAQIKRLKRLIAEGALDVEREH